MKVSQVDERTYIVELSEPELEDVKAEATHSQQELVDIMRALLLMTFVQFMYCRFFRRMGKH